MNAKPLRVRFNKVDEIIKIYGVIRYLDLSNSYNEVHRINSRIDSKINSRINSRVIIGLILEYIMQFLVELIILL